MCGAFSCARKGEIVAKFNDSGAKSVAKPLAQKTGETVNYEGGKGFLTDTRSELFRLATVNFVGEDTFYEKASDRDDRYAALISELAVSDFDWLAKMLTWLRSEGNMRSASLVGAAHAVKARVENGLFEGNADLINSVLQRADEPGEFVAFWRSKFGHTLPKPVLKGLKEAMSRLITSYSFLKYDSVKRGYRMADLLQVVHPSPKDERQDALFKYILASRFDKDVEPDAILLPLLSARRKLMAMPVQERADFLRGKHHTQEQIVTELHIAGMTWEALAGWLQGPMTDWAWEAIIPNMGYMALLRNLRNFDEAGVSRKVREEVAQNLADPAQVASSRQLPFRFLSAYLNAPSDLWRQPLNDALTASLSNVPELRGRTLVLVDTSGSMSTAPVSKNSAVTAAQVAALFGVVMAARNPGSVDLFGFAGGGWGGPSNRVVFPHEVKRGASPLREVDRFVKRIGEVGHGTQMTEAIRQTFKGHDRIVILSDMQCFQDDGRKLADWSNDPIPVPDNVMVYGIDTVGYKATAIDPSLRNRHEFAGLTDAVFRQMQVIEAGLNGRWPWEM